MTKQAEDELKAAYEQLAASQEELRGQFEALRDGQQQLLESEEKYRTLVEHTEDGVFVAQDGNIVFVHEARANRVGDTSDELIGRSFAGLVAPEDRKMVVSRHHARLAGSDLTDDYEFSLLHKGDRATSRVRIRVGTGTYNGLPAVIGTLHDVTEERAQQAALAESEAKYRDLVQDANTIILKWDEQGTITFFNEYAQRFFGYTEEEILGRSVMGTIVPETESGSGRDLRQMIEEIIRDPAKHVHNENENITRDGRRVWIRWQNKPLFDRDGRFTGQLCAGMP
jgi:two-component system sensor histidine kinase/response regulator